MEGFPGELSLLDQEDEHGQGSACLSWSTAGERSPRDSESLEPPHLWLGAR